MGIRSFISALLALPRSGSEKCRPVFSIPEVDTSALSPFEIADHIGNSVADAIKPGMTSSAIEFAVDQFFARQGIEGYFRGYRGYPSSISLSVNSEALGRPASDRALQDGDLAKFETGLIKDSQCAYVGWTFPVGNISKERLALLGATQLALDEGCRAVRRDGRTVEITEAIDRSLRGSGLQPSRDFVGCRIGERPHMFPTIPASLETKASNSAFTEGMSVVVLVIAHAGEPGVEVMSDGFTIVSKDRADSVLLSKTLTLARGGIIMRTHPKIEYRK